MAPFRRRAKPQTPLTRAASLQSPVKRIGPKVLSELKDIYLSGKLTDESYLWCDGMGEDFKQLQELTDLKAALMTGPLAEDAASKSLSSIDLRRASWYYKDKMGTKLGPSVLDTLKIMWDFGEVDESTPIYTEGMDKFYAISEVPPLYKALAMGQLPKETLSLPAATPASSSTGLGAALAPAGGLPDVALEQKRQLLDAKEAELKAREETLKIQESHQNTPKTLPPYAFSETKRRSRRTPYSGPPKRPAANLTESELDDESDANIPSRRANGGYDSLMSDIETENPIYGRSRGRAAPPFVRSERPLSSRKKGSRLLLSGAEEDSETVENLHHRFSRRKARSAQKPQKLSKLSFGSALKSSKLGMASTTSTTHTVQETQRSIYSVFQDEMRTLEDEYAKTRLNLEREYDEQHKYLSKEIDREALKLQDLQESYSELQDQYEEHYQKMQKEYKQVQKERKMTQEEKNKILSELEAVKLKAEEDRKLMMGHVEKREKELEEEKDSLSLEWESLKKEKKRMEEAKKAIVGEKKILDAQVQDERDEVDRERKKIEDDMKAFQEYKDEVEKFLEVRQNIIKTEQEEFIKARASELSKLQELQSAAQNERSIFENRIKEFEKDAAMQVRRRPHTRTRARMRTHSIPPLLFPSLPLPSFLPLPPSHTRACTHTHTGTHLHTRPCRSTTTRPRAAIWRSTNRSWRTIEKLLKSIGPKWRLSWMMRGGSFGTTSRPSRPASK